MVVESRCSAMLASISIPIIGVLLLVLALVAPSMAFAEGGCPPGSYPVGGQGVQGCAPIPGGGAAKAEEARPSGRWVKTWGAIATASTGEVGVAVEKRSKGEATKEAILQCSQLGGASCKIAESYRNQCIALISPSSAEKGGTTISRAGTVEQAKELAMTTCVSRGSVGCKVLYSACSGPIFDAF